MTEITPAASYQRADSSRPVLATTVGGVLREAAERAAGSVALVEGAPDPGLRRRWSYSDLLADSERVARALLGRFAPGERVAVWASNCPEWLLLEFGAALAGLTLVTVNPALRAGEVGYVLGQSRAQGVVLAPAYRGADLAEILAQVRDGLPSLREVISLADWGSFAGSGSPTERLPEVQPGDDAQIQYTSGTTGFPKGAVLCHRGITNNARFCAEILKAGADDVWVNPMPLFHTAGCVLLTLGSVQNLATQVLPPSFDPGLVLGLSESERATMFGGVPTMLLAQLDHPDFASRDLSSVRRAFSGGATVAPALIRRVESALGVPLSLVFAQTEASPSITQTRLDDSPTDRAETLGRPHPQVEVKIADPVTGETVPTGVVGEILTRGYHVMKGYFDNPAATTEAIDAAGWLHTGDLGSMDERGYCRIEGRVKEMIIRGGENIYPREIEQLLHAYPGVADVAVVGVPDDYWGEQVAAFVRAVPGKPVTQEELASYCRTHLASHKTPRHWVFVDAFPLTASGKVQKYVLRERFTSGGTTASNSGTG
jgi:fatty-acyl-CoA synthase